MISRLNRRALLGLLPLLLLAQTARGDELSDRYKIAEKLGSGAFKDVYAVVDHPELALGIFERNRNGAWGDKTNLLEDEKAMLDKIAQAGVPTATILEISTYEGKKAYLQKRFLTANRAPDYQQKRWEVLNETTIEDCHKIESALVAAHMQVSDAQFLIGADGHVVLSDPLSIGVNNGPTSSAKYVLDQIEQAAHEAIDARQAKLLAQMPEAQDPVLQRFFAEAKVALQWNDQAGETALKEALLHYLESGETTPEAKAVAKAIRDGTFEVEFLRANQAPQKPDALPLRLDGLFPRLARDLVLSGWKKVEKVADTLESDVLAAAHALDFLVAKKVPDGVAKDASQPRDPSELVKVLEARRGAPVDPAERARLEGLARAILERPAAPARTSGLSGLLDRAVSDGRDRAASDGR